MKQKDIALVILISAISGIASFFLSNIFFASPSDLQTEVEVIEPISAEFREPDERYFNDKSVNPTQQITIGDDQNQQPFEDSEQ